uniref:Uncharacterized protein n=1 Tax=Kuenenia stuttgartiensis TaxID=174633 RepID=Q1PX33_KUEST|nr:unknown protein [Candidatus Kuenenia stuttgartiensis]
MPAPRWSLSLGAVNKLTSHFEALIACFQSMKLIYLIPLFIYSALLAFKFLDAFCCSCELFLQLVTVLFQHFLFLFCGYETSEERTTSTPAAATATSQNPRHSLASSWFATHFSSPPSYKIRYCADHVSKHIKIVVRYLSIYLIIKLKKFTYFFGVAISLILSWTVLISFCNSFSYFLSNSKLAPLSSFSLNLPVSEHPHVQTSFKICRQFSNASSSMEYGIQYPFLSLLTRPDCFNIFRCCDTAAGVMPTSSAIFLTPSGPLDFRRSIILTRVSTANTLKISEGTNFISLCSYSVKYFSNNLIKILQKSVFVKRFFYSSNIFILDADTRRLSGLHTKLPVCV